MKKSKNLNNVLFYVALILLIAWTIGFLGYNSGGFYHAILVVAVILLFVRGFGTKSS